MNEHEWFKSEDAAAMLEFLTASGAVSDRKLRLFGCACCRRLWFALKDDRSRNAVRIAEQYADGLATEGQREAAQHEAEAAEDDALDEILPPLDSPQTQAAISTAINAGRFWAFDVEVAAGVVSDVLHESAHLAAVDVADACASFASRTLGDAVGNAERIAQCSLLRDIAGNPFRDETAHHSWCTPHVLTAAQAMYEDGNFDRMSMLARMLEDAGCDRPTILAHCLEPENHVRGCWVVDLLLGKA